MADKKYNVILSDKAASMLINHVRFLAKVSAETAKKLHRDIIAEIKVLELMPESYPWISYGEIVANKYRKKLAAKRYLLIYSSIFSFFLNYNRVAGPYLPTLPSLRYISLKCICIFYTFACSSSYHDIRF